jgi:hypothetical protein
VIGAAILIALSALLLQADELTLSPAFEHFYNLEYDLATSWRKIAALSSVF